MTCFCFQLFYVFWQKDSMSTNQSSFLPPSRSTEEAVSQQLAEDDNLDRSNPEEHLTVCFLCRQNTHTHFYLSTQIYEEINQGKQEV